MKVIILGGTGDMGRRAAKDLALRSEVEELTIAGSNLEKAEKLAKALGDKVNATQVNADKKESLIEAIRGYDVVAGAIGPFYKYEKIMVEAALEAKVNYVSICDDYDAIEGVLPLDSVAKELGLSILTGIGWTPGISNILAIKGAEQLDEVEEINIYWAGSASDASGLAVVLHTVHIFTGMVPSFIDGKRVKIQAGSGKEQVDFIEPIGKVDMYHLGHPEPITLSKNIPNIKTVTLKGGLVEGALNKLAILAARLGFTNTAKKKQILGGFFQKSLPLLQRMGPSAALSGIRVDVKGSLKGKKQHLVYQAADNMDNLTGVPLAIGVLMLGSGKINKKGVFAPEAVIEPDSFIKALTERGIDIVCTKGLKV